MSSKSGKRGGGRRSDGRYPSSIEIGALTAGIHSFSEAALALIDSLIKSRREILGTQKTPPVQGQVTAAGGGGVSVAPKKKSTKVPLHERPVLRNIAWVTEWGRQTSRARGEDKKRTRAVSVLTGFVSRFKAFDELPVASMGSYALEHVELFKVLTPDLIDGKSDVDEGSSDKVAGEEGSSELLVALREWWSENNTETFLWVEAVTGSEGGGNGSKRARTASPSSSSSSGM